ncbi:MAG: hypothetical protein ABIZ91_02765 [Gemmatimonadaceae bacterium]
MDNFHEPEGRTERERPLRPADELGPVSDREVPLAPITTPDVINRWLDGELPEPTGLRGDAARSVEFWRRLGEETDKRRRMMTPAHLPERIMAALPPVAVTRDAVMPWYKRDLRLSTTTAMAVGAAIFTLGWIVARALMAR